MKPPSQQMKLEIYFPFTMRRLQQKTSVRVALADFSSANF